MQWCPWAATDEAAEKYNSWFDAFRQYGGKVSDK